MVNLLKNGAVISLFRLPQHQLEYIVTLSQFCKKWRM
jgi:hypothetical protein